MKFLSKTTLTILLTTVAMFFASATFAVVLDSALLKDKISEDINYKYHQINQDGNVIVKNIPVINIQLQDAPLVINTSCDFKGHSANKLAKVELFQNGELLKSVMVPVQIVSYQTVLVATRDIMKGEKIDASNSQFEKTSVNSNYINTIDENFDITNLISQRLIKAGQAVDKRFLAKQTAILRSTPITAIFQSGAIKLTIEVTALENGGIGDNIKVKSTEYNKIYMGKVISSNQVLIQI